MARAKPVSRVKESADYEDLIENLAGQADAFRRSNEPPHEFARRMVGLMRMHQKKWAEPRK